MKRRVIAGFMSCLLAFMLLMPAAGAEGLVLHPGEEGSRVVSKLQTGAASEAFSGLEQDDVQLGTREKTSMRSFSRSSDLGQHLTIEPLEPGQEQASSQQEPQNFVPPSDLSEEISVIVELQEDPVKVFEAGQALNQRRASSSSSTSAAQKVKINLEQQVFKKAALDRLPASFGREYSSVFNGVVVNLPANRVDELLQMPSVKAVYPNSTVFATDLEAEETILQPESSTSFIGSESLWAENVRGEGIKVGVIDTGVAYDHPDLTGAVVDTSGYWGYDFVNEDNEPYETTKQDFEQAQAADPSIPEVNENGKPYYTSHGSHVSGIVAGQGVGIAGEGVVTGVAPEADIYAYKVLGPYGSGSTEDVIAGIERAVDDGMDVINLSLGSESNNEQSADSVAVNNAVKAGVIAVVSAGNSGPGEATVTDPGSAEMAITVGASKPPLLTPIVQAVTTDGTRVGDYFIETFDKSFGIETLTGSYELVDVGLGYEQNYSGKDLTGKIALVKRGEFSFADKALFAIQSGAAAAIIYNNSPEALESGTLGSANVTIPIYAMSGVYGDQLAAALAAGTVTATFDQTVEEDIMAGFSSRGPSKPSFDLKPDISAPGISILSSVPDYEGWYEAQNGTSMAAPHIAGAAALLKQKYPDLTPSEIKALMMNNAVKLIDRTGSRYTHMDQGAGRIALDQVIQAKAIAMTEETTEHVDQNLPTVHYSGSISYGFVGLDSSSTKTVILKDIAGAGSEYNIESLWYGVSPIDLSLSAGSVSVPAGGEQSIDVTVSVPESTSGTYYEGELILTETTGSHVIRMPISIYIGEAPQVVIVSELALTPDIISPNRDGVQDSTNITFTINQYTEYFSLDLFSAAGQWLGTIVESDTGISPGSYILRGWAPAIPDNLYYVVPYAGSSIIEAEPLLELAVPLVTDTGAPVAVVEAELDYTGGLPEGTIRGQVTSDLLIDLFVLQRGLAYSDVIGVAALFPDESGEWIQVDGTIDAGGRFTIEVPVQSGSNYFEVYVYDLAGNGTIQPVQIIEYSYGGQVVPVTPGLAFTNQPFNLDLFFSVPEEVYSASVELQYSTSLTLTGIQASPELEAHQASQQPDVPLTVNGTALGETGSMARYEYSISLNGTEGYSGSGSLGAITFKAQQPGYYFIELSKVTLLDRDGNEIPVQVSPIAVIYIQ